MVLWARLLAISYYPLSVHNSYPKYGSSRCIGTDLSGEEVEVCRFVWCDTQFLQIHHTLQNALPEIDHAYSRYIFHHKHLI